MSSRLRVVVTGLIAQHPTLGGVTWDYLQYVLGLDRLGHEVYYIEDSGEWAYNQDGGPGGNDWVARVPDRNAEHLAAVLDRFGLGDRWAYRFPLDRSWLGLSDASRREVLATADLLLNVSGTIEHPEQYAGVGRRVYIDSDPVFTQVKLASGEEEFRRRVDAHDVHFSFGERLDSAEDRPLAVPATGHAWLPTRQPIVLDEWHSDEPPGPQFRTVMNWTSYQPLRHEGVTYGQKDAEFLRFLSLPTKLGAEGPSVELEVALALEHADWQTWQHTLPAEAREYVLALAGGEPQTAAGLLERAGWQVVDPQAACGGLELYRQYILTSRGEWSVAKNGYVVGQPGWFSCRSACYLAAGRPVIVQDTGFRDILPTGVGLLSFSTLDEAAAAFQEVEADHDRHARAAREIAATYFDSDRVLADLVERALSDASAADCSRCRR
ncbi:MAG: glycosyltransferase [Planctomycetota bacterium]|jgi:hypothetical protein